MSFGRELKDFVEGYAKGEDILESRGRRKLQDVEYERKRLPTDADLPAGGGLAGTAPAIPETTDGTTTGSTGGKGMKGDELAWKDATPEQRGLLNAIAGPESGGRYNVIYGGGSFSDFKDHPRKAVRIQTGPNANRTSSAAGKYQFLGPTWDNIAKKYNLPDFSPENQDKAAWYLAAETYGGEDKLIAALKSGDPQVIAGVGKALRGQWTSLPGGIEQGQDTNTFVQNFTKYRDASPQPATQTAAAAPAAPAGQDPADFAEKLPAEPEKAPAKLSPEAGVNVDLSAVPPDLAGPQRTAIIEPEEEWANQPTMFAREGGMIQRFADGGAPLPPNPVIPEPNPANPSNVAGGGDKYSRFRNYTQQIQPSTPSTFQARRIGQPAAGAAAAPAMQLTDGLTPSQVAFRDLQARLNAPKPAAAPAPAAAAPAPAAQPVRMRQQGINVVMPYGNQGGAFGALPQAQWTKNPTTGKISQRAQRFEQGGVIPDDTVSYARGGKVGDRDKTFKELLRQETRQHPSNVNDRGSGESARDRAARRLSAQEGRASSTAYSNHSEYFKPRKAKPGGGGKAGGDKGKPDKTKTSSTGAGIVPMPEKLKGLPIELQDTGLPIPDPRLAGVPPELRDKTPDVAEDRATRFRPGDLQTTAIPDPRLAGVPPELQSGAFPARPETHSDNTFRGPTAGGTPTSGYEPPTGNFPDRPPIPITQQSGTPEQRYRHEIETSVPSLIPQAQPAPPAQPQGPPAGARTVPPPPRPVDPERTAADVADTRRRMELVTTPPPRSPRDPQGPPIGARTLPEPTDQGEYPDVEQQDWENAPDKRQSIFRSIIGSLLNEQGKRVFGYAEGGVIPEPGQTGYNEAVAGGATARAAPAAAPAPRQDMQPTPKLMADLGTAVSSGVRFLTRHFGLAQDGAVPTPEGGQAQQDGARRFAEGEGAASQQEVDAIDDTVDPQREMSESDRAMTRSAKIVQWYLERGRKDEAEAAAGSLLMHGAQKFGQIGSLAAAAYRKGDLEGTVKALQSAYQYIPDGGSLDIQIDKANNRLVVTHTNADGKEENIPVKPEDLPGIIQGVQNKSLYWKQIMTLSDPETARANASREASQAEWNRQHGITREESLADAKTAAEGEAAKNERERLEEIEKEKRAAAQKETEGKTKTAEELAKEERENKENDRRRLRDAALTRAEKLAETRKDVAWDKVNPLFSAFTEANSAEDANTPEGKAKITEAASRLLDALPEEGRADRFQELTGGTPGDFGYVATTATPMARVGDKPPAGYEGAKPGTSKDGKPIWVIEKDGKQYAVPTS